MIRHMTPLVLLLTATAGARAEQKLATLEADLLVQLLQFVEWPGQQVRETAIIVGFAGLDPVLTSLRNVLKQQQVRGRAVTIRLVHSPEEMRRCDVLFLGVSLREQVRKSLERIRGADVLTVGAFPGFARSGGMVELTANPEKKPLILNPTAARDAGLSFHPGLRFLASVAGAKPNSQ